MLIVSHLRICKSKTTIFVLKIIATISEPRKCHMKIQNSFDVSSKEGLLQSETILNI